jgi:flagellar biosynthesis/type III secretory pathway chaperone
VSPGAEPPGCVPPEPSGEAALACARELLATLGREREALATRDREGILAAAADKHALVDRLQALLDTDPSRSPVPEMSTPGRDDLPGVLGAIAASNRANGRVVEAARRQTRRALEVLQGMGAPEGLYDAGGGPQALGRSGHQASA